MSPEELTRVQEWGERFRRDPVEYVRRVFRAEPTDQQAQLLRAVADPGAKVAVRSGHGTGKTTALAWIILWYLPLHRNALIPCTAPTGHQLYDLLWAEVQRWQPKMPPELADCVIVKQSRVEIRGYERTKFAVARTARKENPEALAGFHSENLLFLIDEASGVPEQIFQVAEGALSTPGSRVVMTSNPTRITGYFYDAFGRNRDKWTRLHFSGPESPLVDHEFVREMGEKYGEDSDIYRVRVLGEFPKASVLQLIPQDLVEAALGAHLPEEAYRFAPRILGVDVARFGDDRSAVFYRQGRHAELALALRSQDTMTLAGRVAALEDELRADAVFVDEGGVGGGVVDRLRQLGRSPIPVNFGGAPLDGRYQNKRAEMWCLLKAWLQEGAEICPRDRQQNDIASDLRDDLVGPEYGFSSSGKLQLERKEDMKKRGLASPDLGDALALTFAAPVRPRDGTVAAGGGRMRFAQTKYDLFGRRE